MKQIQPNNKELMIAEGGTNVQHIIIIVKKYFFIHEAAPTKDVLCGLPVWSLGGFSHAMLDSTNTKWIGKIS